MKTRRTIPAVALTLMLLGGLITATAPASAGTLSWTTVTIPSTSDNVLASTDVADIAISGDTLLVAGGSQAGEKIFVSADEGETWASINTDPDEDDDDRYVHLIAVAPDDNKVIVTADTEDGSISISTDGGNTWDDLQIDGATDVAVIRDIAISTESSGKHYIAVAGSDDSAEADVWYYILGETTASWISTKDNSGFHTTATDGSYNSANAAVAVAFSPNFPIDQVMVTLVGEWGGTDRITLEVFSFNSEEWNAKAGFDGYMADIVAGITDLTGIDSGSLALDPDYLGSDDAMRLTFVGLTLAGGTDTLDRNGIYRASDTTVKELKTSASTQIHSVAFNRTHLVAGAYDTNTVYYSDDPISTTPAVDTARSLKRPGGDERVVLAWLDGDLMAGTSGDESAFAISRNSGVTFNDISLIDTELEQLEDVMVSPDGGTVYLISDDGNNMSLWLYSSSWKRVLSIRDIISDSAFIVRTAPLNPEVVYVAHRVFDPSPDDDRSIYYSTDGGEERWLARTCRVDVRDLAVEGNGDIVYAIERDSGQVTRSPNAGFTWSTPKDTELVSANMIASLGEGLLLAGSGNLNSGGGYVSYSTDSGGSWTRISERIEEQDIHVIASGLAAGDYIYAASEEAGGGIYRWQIGSSTSWKKIHDVAEAFEARGIVLRNGTLYIIAADDISDSSRLYRTLDPTTDQEGSWDEVPINNVLFNTAPQALRISQGSNKLWAIDTMGDALYSFTDTLVAAAPTPVAPEQDFAVKVNPVTGRAAMITFLWERPADNVEAYDLRIAFDQGFDEVVKEVTVGDDGIRASVVIGPYADEDLEWDFDTVYFWQVRVKGNSPVKSPWSEVHRFVIEEAVVESPVDVEETPRPEVTMEVPPPTDVTIPPPPAPPPVPVPQTPPYIWAMIVIGALLVIALIFLIVVTRRAT